MKNETITVSLNVIREVFMEKDKSEKENCTCNNEMLSRINRIPDEFFYNNCDCQDCDCEHVSGKEEMLCSCGYMNNPLGMDFGNYSCQCNGKEIT